MTRKILIACVILLLMCAALSAESSYDINGLWHIHGEGFAEKGFVRVSLELFGDMNITTNTINEISRDLKEVISNGLTIKVDPVHDEWLEGDMKAITKYEIHMRLNATGLSIKAWEEGFPNGIKIPVMLPEIRPTVDDPFVFPAYSYDDIKYQLSITGIDSGKLRLNGYVNVNTVGKCELNADCVVWKDGSKEPQRESETSSGCNSGVGLVMLLLLPGVIKRVWN